MVELGILEPCSASEWASLAFIIPKQDGHIQQITNLCLIYPVLSNGILESWKGGFRTRQGFNSHKDKTRESQRGMFMAHAHDITKNQTRRYGSLQKRIPGNHERGAIGHNNAHSIKQSFANNILYLSLQRCLIASLVTYSIPNSTFLCNTTHLNLINQARSFISLSRLLAITNTNIFLWDSNVPQLCPASHGGRVMQY